jgi:hypothetical protein
VDSSGKPIDSRRLTDNAGLVSAPFSAAKIVQSDFAKLGFNQDKTKWKQLNPERKQNFPSKS